MIFKLSIKSLWHRKLSTFLSLLLLAFGTAIISILYAASHSLDDQMSRNIRGVDLVIGAKGSPLQIVLGSLFHIDAPTGNISLEDYEMIKSNPLVQNAIPLSFGDSYQGFRIVGSTAEYLDFYEATLANGTIFNKPMEVVIGHGVAQQKALHIGDQIYSNHGLSAEGETHESAPFIVKGILSESHTVLDKLIITPYQSIWHVHEHEENDEDHDTHEHSEGEEHSHEEHKQITSALVFFKGPMALFSLPRFINEKTQMQAALPSIEVNRIYSLMESSIQFLSLLGIAVLVISGISIFIALYQSVLEERSEYAFLRSTGASTFFLAGTILSRCLILALSGYILGLFLSSLFLKIISAFFLQGYAIDLQFLYSSEQLWVFGIIGGLSLLASIVPIWQIVNLNITKELANA